MKRNDMSNDELIREIHRVENLLRNATNGFTIKQNKKYLEKLYREKRGRK